MFLATTALTDYWDKEQAIVMLGSWCLRHDRRDESQGLIAEVMPSPWKDRDRFNTAIEYLDQCQERMLSRLVKYLASAHNVSCSQRYWRILIGPWLLHYLHAFYDRYVHLTDAFSRYPIRKTIVLDKGSFHVPCDADQLTYLVESDPYNLQLLSQMIHSMGYSFPAQALSCAWNCDVRYERPGDRVRRALKGTVSWGFRLLSEAVNPIRGHSDIVGLWSLGVSCKQTWRLAFRSHLCGVSAVPYELEPRWPFMISGPVFDERRNGLKALAHNDEFERIFVDSLPNNFPVLYLEAYASARQVTLEKVKKVPSIMMSAEAWLFDEPFKFLAAELSERKTRIVTVQHGGGGMFRSSPAELHESRIGDAYMVWGWAGHLKAGRQANLPSQLLSTLPAEPELHFASRRHGIVFISTANLRYLLRFHSCPIGIHREEYIQWQLRFLEAVPHNIRSVLLFRSYPGEYGAEGRARITEGFAEVKMDTNSRIHETMSQARVCVVDHIGTTLLEALKMDIPTILFWDPAHTEIRDEAISYIENLRGVGILWDSPEKAAAKVAEVYDDPMVWWNSRAVRSARKAFVDRFAFGNKEWKAMWAAALSEELTIRRKEMRT